MIYNVLYTNYNKWKQVILWKKSLTKTHEVWSGDKFGFTDLKYLHGNFSLFKYGHNGFSACTMICLNAAYRLLYFNVENIDRKFINDIIDSGIDIYQAFINTEDGKRVLKKQTKLITETEMITKFFRTIYNIDDYDTSLVEFSDVERPDIYNYNKWLYNNISFFTDRTENDIYDYACIITINSECIVIYYDNDSEYYYLFDPQGRGLAFFDIPSKQNQYLFLASINEEIPYSNMNSYLLKTKGYENIVEFIKKIIPYQRNFRSTYITLRFKDNIM